MTAARFRRVQGFSVLQRGQWPKTLVGKLTKAADRMRNIYTLFGMRPYVVRWVFTRWSLGRRGQGIEQVLAEIPLLPTPKITELVAVDNITTEVGTDEFGTLSLEEISMRYTEDQLMGRSPFGDSVPKDMNFYYEIEFPGQNGLPGVRRRFEPQSAPALLPGKFQWQLKISRAGENRMRDGTPED